MLTTKRVLLAEIARLKKHEAMLAQVRDWLEQGATISRTAPNTTVLIPETGYGGVTVIGPL